MHTACSVMNEGSRIGHTFLSLLAYLLQKMFVESDFFEGHAISQASSLIWIGWFQIARWTELSIAQRDSIIAVFHRSTFIR